MSAKVYTRGGDKGLTSLVGGLRVSKDNIRIEAYGAIDEANSFIGLVRSKPQKLSDGQESNQDIQFLDKALLFVQQKLFNCSSIVAIPPDAGIKTPDLSDNDIKHLEQFIDEMEQKLKPQTSFIIPGGTVAASMLHIARTVIRRSERKMITLNSIEPLDPLSLAFINRVSDLLFVAARYVNWLGNIDDINWDKDF